MEQDRTETEAVVAVDGRVDGVVTVWSVRARRERQRRTRGGRRLEEAVPDSGSDRASGRCAR